MSIRVAINGFGRIGRLTLRALLERKDKQVEIVAINDLTDLKSIKHLLKYDSLHYELKNNLKIENNLIEIDDKKIVFFSEKNPELIPWKEVNADVVIESTGLFASKLEAEKHLRGSVQKVLVSAPCKDADITIVYGVNHKKLTNDHKIISNGSCTTNCLAPIVFLLEKKIGIHSGYMTTVHAVTGDQKTIDTFHKDLRRSRNASISMIPTSTGAAKAVGEVLPQLVGKLDGSAIRVPTANVSLIDFCFHAKRPTTSEEINNIIKNASCNDFKGIIEVVDEPMVSVDFNHNPHSSILDTSETKVIKENFCRILSWYDNEWGFSNRLIDVTKELF